ncbi:hypothetical protein IHQ71_19365 [Rhizobium sp. TH2]|uniref:hypothetical protein n=1 Tax=Rhizobium sp. TH2 TaxID=2775403 RepID=UPI0021581A83|nr:hypothetical protein [Rhizobium sp. TH2]UVC07358.1 hypothetical protein IHQ71_19365 [Rhizobium sp. TH2]
MPTITDDRTTTQTVAGTTGLTLTRKGSIKINGSDDNVFGISVATGATGNNVIVNGLIHATNSEGGTAVGIWSGGDNFRLNIGKSGEVQGNDGIVTNEKTYILNSGHIIGLDGDGVVANGFVKLENDGSIRGVHAVSLAHKANVYNYGDITGSDIGILGSNSYRHAIENEGTIKGMGSAAIQTGIGDDRIRNAGKIIGDISTGDGEDRIHIFKGSIQGNIITGAGDDRLIINSNKFTLIEENGGGFEEVYSKVSYALPDYVETLRLLGAKNINATGSENGNNYIYGNRGDNVLNGLGGHNELFGLGGTDTLIGGDDYDLFGIGKFYGRDTVENYQDGTDQIDIKYIGSDNFEELKSHIKDHGNDTWIEFNNNVLILKGVDHNVLDESDFLFDY